VIDVDPQDQFQTDLPSEADQLAAIAQTIRYADDFSVIFAICTDTAHREDLITRLNAQLDPIEGTVLRVDSETDSLLRRLLDIAPRSFVHVIGLNEVGPAGEDGALIPFVANLNANRNAFPTVYRGVVILWMPVYFAEALHRGAPDFFSIRSGLYQFTEQSIASPQREPYLGDQSLNAVRHLASDEFETRIQRIEGLIDELRASSEAIDRASLARLYTSLGDAHFAGGIATPLALEAWSHAGELYAHLGDPKGQGEILERQANLYFQVGRNAEAAAAWMQALDLLSQSTDGSELGQVHYGLGRLYFREGRIQDALEAWDVADSHFQHSGNSRGLGNVARSKGDLYFQLGRNQDALRAWEEADRYFIQSNTPQGLGNVALSRGDLHFREGRNQDALQEWQSADRYYEQSGKPQERGNVAFRRGNLQFREGRNQEALAAWDIADEYYELSGNPQGRGNIASSRGYLHFQEGRDQDALEAWEAADQYFQQSRNPMGLGNVARARGNFYFREGRSDEALRAWKAAEQYYQQSGDPVGLGNVALSRGDLDYQEGRNAEAEESWRSAARYFRQCNHRHNLELVQNRLRQLGIEESDSPED